MPPDDNITTEPSASPEAAPETPEITTPAISSQPNGSTPTDLLPEAPKSPTSDAPSIPVESQNGGVNESESKPVESPKEPQPETVSASPVQPVSAPAPLTPQASQPQSLAQQDQTGFIRALLAKANAKLGLNRQKRLDNLMQ
ncbi:MAG: hypothetical protein AAB629_00275, partial [Patescibacteria group bacterium]